MMPPDQRMREVSQLLADDYSQKILVNTYSVPMSAQRLSKACQIPIAACYRRIHELEEAGLLTVDREKEIYKGRKVRLYRCKLRSATIKFNNGKFAVRYDCVPDQEMKPDIVEEPVGSLEPTEPPS